jgi:hypothetical protein
MNEKNLKDIAAIITAITALIAAVLALFQNSVKLWSKILWPLIKLLSFLGTLAVPIGIILWFFMGLAAENSSRLDEQVVVLSLVGQATVAIFIYALFWGMVLCPKIRFLLKWSTQQSTDNDKQEKGESKSDARESDIKGTSSENGEGVEPQDKQGGAI